MVDACEWEQSALLKRYVLEDSNIQDRPGGANGSSGAPPITSLAPFVPCAPSRVPHILQAARIGPEDVLYDLGCGDGAILLEAARRCGCQCVGLEIEEPCLTAAVQKAEELDVGHLCRWVHCDLCVLPAGSLGQGVGTVGKTIGTEMCSEGRAALREESLKPPTVALVFLTSFGLVRLAEWLHVEWATSPCGLRVVTCVESLDAAVDYSDQGALFEDPNALQWPVCHDDARWGVFVVPPAGVEVFDWQSIKRPPLQFTRDDAEATSPVLLRAVLSAEDIQLIDDVGRAHLSAAGPNGGSVEESVSLFDLPHDEAGLSSVIEDAMHSMLEHRILHLHGIQGLTGDRGILQGIEDRLISTMRAQDVWGILQGREVNVRSFEYHVYGDGGSVLDPQHRDDGSLLTISVLLSPEDSFSGGEFRTWERGEPATHELHKGDAVLFVSEKRHNVSTVRGDRRALIVELWEGPRNAKNRHL